MRLTRIAVVTTAIVLLSAGVVWLTNSRAASDPTGLADTTLQGPGLERYVDSSGGFFFDYPAGLKITVTDDGDDSHVIFGDTANGETRLMVVTSPYDLNTPLTEDMIRDEFADITPPVDRTSLPSGITAFLFRRAAATIGATRVALFVHIGMLYQVY